MANTPKLVIFDPKTNRTAEIDNDEDSKQWALDQGYLPATKEQIKAVYGTLTTKSTPPSRLKGLMDVSADYIKNNPKEEEINNNPSVEADTTQKDISPISASNEPESERLKQLMEATKKHISNDVPIDGFLTTNKPVDERSYEQKIKQTADDLNLTTNPPDLSKDGFLTAHPSINLGDEKTFSLPVREQINKIIDAGKAVGKDISVEEALERINKIPSADEIMEQDPKYNSYENDILPQSAAALEGLAGGVSFNILPFIEGLAGNFINEMVPDSLKDTYVKRQLEDFTAENIKLRQEANPITNTVSEIAGAILPAIGTGGLTLVPELAKNPKLVGQTARALSSIDIGTKIGKTAIETATKLAEKAAPEAMAKVTAKLAADQLASQAGTNGGKVLGISAKVLQSIIGGAAVGSVNQAFADGLTALAEHNDLISENVGAKMLNGAIEGGESGALIGGIFGVGVPATIAATGKAADLIKTAHSKLEQFILPKLGTILTEIPKETIEDAVIKGDEAASQQLKSFTKEVVDQFNNFYKPSRQSEARQRILLKALERKIEEDEFKLRLNMNVMDKISEIDKARAELEANEAFKQDISDLQKRIDSATKSLKKSEFFDVKNGSISWDKFDRYIRENTKALARNSIDKTLEVRFPKVMQDQMDVQNHLAQEVQMIIFPDSEEVKNVVDKYSKQETFLDEAIQEFKPSLEYHHSLNEMSGRGAYGQEVSIMQQLIGGGGLSYALPGYGKLGAAAITHGITAILDPKAAVQNATAISEILAKGTRGSYKVAETILNPSINTSIVRGAIKGRQLAEEKPLAMTRYERDKKFLESVSSIDGTQTKFGPDLKDIADNVSTQLADKTAQVFPAQIQFLDSKIPKVPNTWTLPTKWEPDKSQLYQYDRYSRMVTDPEETTLELIQKNNGYIPDDVIEVYQNVYPNKLKQLQQSIINLKIEKGLKSLSEKDKYNIKKIFGISDESFTLDDLKKNQAALNSDKGSTNTGNKIGIPALEGTPSQQIVMPQH